MMFALLLLAASFVVFGVIEMIEAVLVSTTKDPLRLCKFVFGIITLLAGVVLLCITLPRVFEDVL